MNAFLAVFALAAVASADPAVLYAGNTVQASGYTGYPYLPYAAASWMAAQPAAKMAEMKEMEKVEMKTLPYFAGSYMPYTSMPYTSTYMTSYPVATTTYRLAKRESEPVMEEKKEEVKTNILPYMTAAFPYAAGYPWTTYSAMPYANTWAWNHAAATYPYAAHAAVYPYAAYNMATLDDARMKAESTPEYAGKGEYAAVSAGAVHLAKRSADADAFYPYAVNAAFPYYNNFAYTTGYPYAATGFPYAANTFAYSGYPYHF